MSCVSRALTKHKALRVDKTDPSATHIFVARNGNLFAFNFETHEVLLEVMDAFRNDLNTTSSNCHPNFKMMEHRNPDSHKFYIEADLPEDILSPESIVPLMRTLLKEFCPNNDCLETCLISKNGKKARYVWPKLLVSKSNAAIIITRLGAYFAAHDKNRESEYRWKAIFNPPKTYMTTTTIDFVNCFSLTKCSECKTKSETMQCLNCDATGFICDSSNSFRSYKVINFEENDAPSCRDIVDPSLEIMVSFSMATAKSGTAGTVTPEQTPITFPIGTPHCAAVNQTKQKAFGHLWGKQGLSKKNSGKVTERVVKRLKTMINKKSSKFHSKSIVRAECTYFDEKKKRYWVPVLGPGCCSCKYKGKDHKDSHITFLFDVNGMKQVCNSSELVDGVECKKKWRQMPYTQLTNVELKSIFKNHVVESSSSSLSSTCEMQNCLYIAEQSVVNILEKRKRQTRKDNVIGEYI